MQRKGVWVNVVRYVMVVDLKICVGCDSCTVSCKLSHDTGFGIKLGKVIVVEEGVFPSVKKFYVPLLCMQCRQPECLKVCPTGATYRNRDGVVLVDYERCMGCKYCIIACPYKARHFNTGIKPPKGVPIMDTSITRKGVVEKCDFCIDRIDVGKRPMCVESCQYEARTFGNLDDPKSNVWKILSTQEVMTFKSGNEYDPSVFYVGVI